MSSYAREHIPVPIGPDIKRAMGANGLGADGSLAIQITDSAVRNTSGDNRAVEDSSLSGGSMSICQTPAIPPITRKRRGGSRRACNECKQQKVRCNRLGYAGS
jgi:hypothetical protein